MGHWCQSLLAELSVFENYTLLLKKKKKVDQVFRVIVNLVFLVLARKRVTLPAISYAEKYTAIFFHYVFCLNLLLEILNG